MFNGVDTEISDKSVALVGTATATGSTLGFTINHQNIDVYAILVTSISEMHFQGDTVFEFIVKGIGLCTRFYLNQYVSYQQYTCSIGTNSTTIKTPMYTGNTDPRFQYMVIGKKRA